jgi:Tfp pilus assembly protein PilX
MKATNSIFAAHKSLSLRSRQTGATLIVGLVLLLVLTVVGVSGMNTATMEVTQAGNTQFQQDAFQLAESAIDTAIAQEVYDFDAGTPENVAPLGVPDYDRQAVISYMPPHTAIPDEANSESIPGATRAFHFQIRAVGTGPRGGSSTQTQSFYIRGRALN